MSDRKANILRNLAAGLCERLVVEGRILEAEREDFLTSLVRQWITYDGNATWFLGEEQVNFVQRRTPLGKPLLVTERRRSGWFAQLQQEWKIDPEHFPDITAQLNRGQSAETITSEGIPLRLWVNPKERCTGVEQMVSQPGLPRAKTDYRKIATHEIRGKLGTILDKNELAALADSVAKQWQRFQGHACIFLDRGQQLVLTLTERDDGTCHVVTARMRGDLEPLLSSLGFPPAAIPDVVARINLGQEIAFQDKEEVPSILWYDPKQRRILVRPTANAIVQGKLPLGRIEIEPRAAMVLARSGQDASYFLQRHASGDCGDLSDKSKEELAYRLYKGCVHSCYHTSLGEMILVFTTADRQSTVISAPDPQIAEDMVRIVQAHANRAVFCPRCTAVLQRWEHNERQRTCPHCSHSFFR